MTTVLVNPYLQFGGGAGGGGSVAITYAGKTIPAEGTGAITISGDYLDPLSAAMSELTNDVVLAVFECGATDAIPTPSNFAHVTGSPVAATASSELTVFWHRAASDTLPGISEADPGDHWIGFQAAFRGVKASGNPWNVLGSGTATDSGGVLTIPGVTTNVNNCMIVVILGHGFDDSDDTNYSNWACTSLTGGTLTEIEDEGTPLGGGGGIGMAYGYKATAGATGNITVDIDNTATFAYLVIALEPAAP